MISISSIDLHEKQCMFKYVCMVTLRVLFRGILIKPNSPKMDGGREIRSSGTIEISGLKNHPTYMVIMLCRVVTPYDMRIISRKNDMLMLTVFFKICYVIFT